ncbi:MAG: ATP synthase F0 subunit C [Candidatus Kerfeldbacteria bacterium]|nr:ATP synthase F0 subunit C [Candidatus Kerfeldbacteria bacterium]
MDAETMKYLAAAIAIAVGGIGPGIGQGLIASRAMDAMGRNPSAGQDLFVRMIVAMSIVESIAIYAFVVALMVLFL